MNHCRLLVLATAYNVVCRVQGDICLTSYFILIYYFLFLKLRIGLSKSSLYHEQHYTWLHQLALPGIWRYTTIIVFCCRFKKSCYCRFMLTFLLPLDDMQWTHSPQSESVKCMRKYSLHEWIHICFNSYPVFNKRYEIVLFGTLTKWTARLKHFSENKLQGYS